MWKRWRWRWSNAAASGSTFTATLRPSESCTACLPAVRRDEAIPNAIARAATSVASAAIAHGSFEPRARRGADTGTATEDDEAPSAIPASCSLTSCAVRTRSSGSFVRQVRTRRSSPGGASGDTCETAGGSLLMIAEISVAWLRPSNARRPVAIS